MDDNGMSETIGESNGGGMALDGLQILDSISADDARRVLAQDRQQRVKWCWDGIQTVVKQFNCELTAVAQLTQDGRIEAKLLLRALET